MRKWMIAAVFLFCGNLAFAGKDIALVIDAKKDGADLVKISCSPGGTMKNAWFFKGKEEPKNKQILFVYFTLSPKWQEKEIVFKAEKDCEASFSISVSQGASLLCDNVRVEGAGLKNGDFEKGDEGWKMIDFKNNDGPPEVVEEEGIDSGKALKIISSAQTARQFIKLKGGQPIKVRFSFKEL